MEKKHTKETKKKQQITLPCSIVEGNLHNKQFLVYMSEKKKSSWIERCGLILALGTQFNINLEVNKLEVWMKRQKEQN